MASFSEEGDADSRATSGDGDTAAAAWPCDRASRAESNGVITRGL